MAAHWVEGKVYLVEMSLGKLLRRFTTPIGSDPNTPRKVAPSVPVSAEELAVALERSTFEDYSKRRPCILLRGPAADDEEELIIVPITGLDKRPLEQVYVPEEMHWALPIHPTPSYEGTGPVHSTVPAWGDSSRNQVPSYVIDIPVKVLSRFVVDIG